MLSRAAGWGFTLRLALSSVVLALASLLVFPSPLFAQAPPGGYDEEEAQAIDQMLMCPVCPAESIDQAQVPLARQMRQRVREMLAAGAERQEVLDYFASRYGQNVLASPPKSGVNLLAWLVPLAGLAAALGVLALALRAMTGRGRRLEPAAAGPTPLPQADLAPYLEAVDRRLSNPGSGGAPTKPTEPADESGEQPGPESPGPEREQG